MARPLARCLPLLLIAASLGTQAQGLPDPTRPPPGWGPGETPATAPARTAPSRLQLIVRSPGEKPWALIDGRRASIGDRVDGARLTGLTDHEAILQGPNGTRRLSLTPGVSSHPTSTASQETRR